MIFDNIDLSLLPENSEEAFVEYEKMIRKNYKEISKKDQLKTDDHGNYIGQFEPERSYMNAIIAFIDEYNLDVDVPDISELQGYDYYKEFLVSMSIIEYVVGRLSLRIKRGNTGEAGTPIAISSSYKAEIGGLLETIRKIVNSEVKDKNKKDKIFIKIASLQSEVDRDRTTIDAVFGRAIEFCEVVNLISEKSDPLLNKIEKLKKIIWDGSDRIEMLPKKERKKLIPDNSNEEIKDLDDEIPF